MVEQLNQSGNRRQVYSTVSVQYAPSRLERNKPMPSASIYSNQSDSSRYEKIEKVYALIDSTAFLSKWADEDEVAPSANAIARAKSIAYSVFTEAYHKSKLRVSPTVGASQDGDVRLSWVIRDIAMDVYIPNQGISISFVITKQDVEPSFGHDDDNVVAMVVDQFDNYPY